VADKTADDDLDLKPADAGAMFRVEMFLTNTFLGYWKHLLAVVGVVLLGVLAWGQYRDTQRNHQRAYTAQIAQTMAALPADLEQLPEAIAQDPSIDRSKLESVGDDLVAVANGASGTAKSEALLKAAELFRLAGNVEKQRSALTAASSSAPSTLAYAAESGLANLELAQGQGDAAVERLKKLAASQKGFLAEQSTLDLGLALEQLGRKDEAYKVYDDFKTRFKDSPRIDLVDERESRLSSAAAPSGAPAPAPADAPAPAPTDAPAPAAPAPADAPAPGGAG
jgi:tetratricopeptide (TPR) repeat protein